MKRLFFLLIVIMALASLPTRGLQAQGGDPQLAGVDRRLDGITIRVSVISGVQYDNMYKSIPDFEKATGAKVEIVSQLDGFNIDRKQKTDYATNAVDYDVAWNHTSFMMQYIDFVEDLNQYFTADELAQYSKAIIDSATVDGKLLLIPRMADVSQLYYRADLFGDAKIQEAYKKETGKDLAVPTTLEEVDAVARFFAKGGYAKYGYGIAGKDEGLTGRFYELLFASGGQFLDDQGQPAFNSEVGVKVAELLHAWWQDGVIPKDTPSLIWDGVGQNFCNGDVAMQLDWPGFYGYFGDAKSCPNIAGKFGLATGFTGFAGANARRIGWAGAHAFSIPKQARQKEAAAQLIKFLTSEKIAYEEAKLGPLPCRNDVWARVIADAEKSANPLDKQRLEIASKQIGEDFKTPRLTAKWIPVSDVVFPTLQKIMIGDVDAKTGLDQAAKDAIEALK
jgi:multiple sugar transport system substrate-binding protein